MMTPVDEQFESIELGALHLCRVPRQSVLSDVSQKKNKCTYQRLVTTIFVLTQALCLVGTNSYILSLDKVCLQLPYQGLRVYNACQDLDSDHNERVSFIEILKAVRLDYEVTMRMKNVMRFEEVDMNNNSYLELKEIIISENLDPDSSPELLKNEKKKFQESDLDNDSVLNFNEFMIYSKRSRKPGKTEYQYRSNNDLNQDDVLDKEELGSIELIVRFDTNGDGTLDIDEIMFLLDTKENEIKEAADYIMMEMDIGKIGILTLRDLERRCAFLQSQFKAISGYPIKDYNRYCRSIKDPLVPVALFSISIILAIPTALTVCNAPCPRLWIALSILLCLPLIVVGAMCCAENAAILALLYTDVTVIISTQFTVNWMKRQATKRFSPFPGIWGRLRKMVRKKENPPDNQ